MSVESTTTKVIYQGNGTTIRWPVPFAYNQTEHLRLMVADGEGRETEITDNFSVVVSGSGDTSILYPASGTPLASGNRLVIYRQTPRTQIVDLQYGGAFSPETLENDGLDRVVMMIQEQQEALDRAVKVDIASSESPEELLEAISASRHTAVASAAAAAASAEAARASEARAAGSAAHAAEQRKAARACAQEAQAARDVALAQTETCNTLMATELAKINTIVAANGTDQRVAISAARQWAEQEPGLPVAYDEDGTPRYSARHWADNARKIAIEPPTAERRGGIRVGAGLHLETGDDGETDVLVADMATEAQPGLVRPDGTTVTLDRDGTIHGMEAEPVVSDADNRVPTSRAVREYVPPTAALAAMPGEKYITLSLPSSGSTITAPADGYISWGMEPNINEWSTLSCTVSTGDSVYRRRMTTHNYGGTPMGLVFPVTAGDVVTLIYERVSTTDARLQFIYANGALSEGDQS